jgi:hypothetical protein
MQECVTIFAHVLSTFWQQQIGQDGNVAAFAVIYSNRTVYGNSILKGPYCIQYISALKTSRF